MNKKQLSLINDPYRFVVDNCRIGLGKIPITYTPWLKKSGINKFSIVSAVYGVEKYLDDFFSSIVNQTLVFEEHIELILVDDGSTDNSANVIKKWAKKYPKNIKYVKKVNGGQASARNLGVKQVSNEWVTFIDPDDFISKNYFEIVDKTISSHKNACLVSCNFIFYKEANGILSDSHPLKYRFENKVSILSASEMKGFLQLSVNSAFFSTETIRKYDLSMDCRIKPNFEDAHFVGKYLLARKNDKVIFLNKPKYYYRKRKDESSTLDTAWGEKELYSDKLIYGSLDLLAFSKNKLHSIPTHIQRTVLYDLIWYFRKLLNTSNNLSFLSTEERATFLNSIKSIFEKIDTQVIRDFELVSCNSYFKTGWLSLYKDSKPDLYDVEIEEYDSVKKQVKLRYYFDDILPEEEIILGGNRLLPSHEKIRKHKFLDSIFVLERIIWISLVDGSGHLFMSIGGKQCRLLLGDSDYQGKISLDIISKYFEKPAVNESTFSFGIRVLRNLARLSAYLPKYQDAWVFMDRDTHADDNAEHLYRYIRQQNPKLNSRFILRKKSHDWSRLKRDSFNLIPFGSIRHMILMFNAKKLISSHADNYVINFPPQAWFDGIMNKKFIFLQHGVIKHDLSEWLNKKPIKLFVTTTNQEYESIIKDSSNYKYTSKEVKITGLARHDALWRLSQNNFEKKRKKTLVIIPTWRQHLVGKTEWMSNKRKVNNDFYLSQYATTWKKFLHSKNLKELVLLRRLEVVFFPHVNMSPYLEWFNVPGYIKSATHGGESSIQDLFVEGSIMLTDYSSVAFDMAFLEKPVIYYQFDKEDFFGGAHTTKEGYFKYQRDGFGPVCQTESEVISYINKLAEDNCVIESKYLNRIKSTFLYKDGKCCERIYNSILNLE